MRKLWLILSGTANGIGLARLMRRLGLILIPNPTIKVAPKHEQLTTEFFVAV